MSTEAIMILLVAILAAGTLLAGRAGIRSIQEARKVVFYRTRRSYMLAGWQWLALALVLLSSTVASAFFGEPIANQVFASPTQAATMPASGLPSRTPTSFLDNLNGRTATPAPPWQPTQTDIPSQTTPEPASVTPTRHRTLTSTPAPTLPPTATQTVTRTSIPSPTQDLSALATRAARTLEAQLAIAALSNTPTRTKTSTPTATQTFMPTSTSTLTPSSTPTRTLTPTQITSRRTPSPTSAASAMPSQTQTRTSTPAATLTQTPTPTWTIVPTLTSTSTATFTPTQTASHTPNPTFTSTPTATTTQTSTSTASPTATPTQTFTSTASATITPSPTFTATFTPLPTQTPSQTASPTPTSTFTVTLSATPSQTQTLLPTFTPTQGNTLTSTSTQTPSPTTTFTSTPSRVPSPTRTPMFVKVTVYFTDNERLIAGQLPYEVAVTRSVRTSKNVVVSVLDEFFKGPGDVERNQGLALISNGFTGYKKVGFVNGGLHVYLAGNCQSNGTLYNISRPLMASLKQFPEVQFVKIYDQFGYTREPAARVDSIPACLDPSFTPSVTPLPTSTLRSGLTATPTRTPIFIRTPFIFPPGVR